MGMSQINIHEDFHIVPYDKNRHSRSAAETLASSFSHDHWPIWDYASFRLTQDLCNLMASVCDLNYVVEEKNTGKCYGQIFCMAPSTPWMFIRSIPLILKIVLVFTTGMYFLKKTAWQHVYCLRMAIPLLKAHPVNKPHFEVFLFAMHQKLQGKGLGKKLMDKAILEMDSRKAEKVILLTDSTMSWQFYEKYSYKRIIEVNMKSAYWIAMQSKQEFGYIYELNVPEKANAINSSSII